MSGMDGDGGILMDTMTDDESKLSFRELAIKRSLTDPKDKDMFVWVYRWFTSMTVKKLMFTKNWDETKDLIEDWLKMDRDIGPAVRGYSMDDEVRNGISQIKDVSDMLKDKQKSMEIV